MQVRPGHRRAPAGAHSLARCRNVFAMATSMHNGWNRHRIAFGLVGMMLILAVVAYFAGTGGHRAAAMIAAQAGMCFCLAYSSARRRRLDQRSIG